MSKHDMAQIDLRDGDQRIQLRRGTASLAPALSLPVAAAVSAPVAAVPALGAAASAPATAPVAASSAGKKYLEIKSPTPGTFYAAPSADAEPFVKVGSKVKPDSVVC